MMKKHLKLGAVFLLLMGIFSVLSAQDIPDELQPKYNVVYLTAVDDGSDTLLAHIDEAELNEWFTFVTVHEWRDVVMFDDLLRIDGLVLDSSAADLIDQEWLIAKYDSGMVLSAIEWQPEDYADLIETEGLADRYECGDTVYIASHHLDSSDLGDIDGRLAVQGRSGGGNRVNRLSSAEGRDGFLPGLFHDIRSSKELQLDLFQRVID